MLDHVDGWVFAGIVAGSLVFCVIQICLLKFMSKYKYPYILPIVFLLFGILLSVPGLIPDLIMNKIGHISDNVSIGYELTEISKNYQPREFQFDFQGTLIYWLPRLLFLISPFLTTAIIESKKGGKSERFK